MRHSRNKKWLFYTALALVALLLIPYFSFLYKSLEPVHTDSTIRTQNADESIPPSLDELLEKQKPE